MAKKWKTIDPGTWKPEKEGDSIEGVLIDKTPKTADVGAKYHIENQDGMFLVWGSAILDDRMKYVNVGDEVRVVFKGKAKNKKGQDVNLYDVAVAENDDSTTSAEGDSEEPVPVEKIEDAPKE